MLRYFPTPYSDELLYSVLARYHSHTGNSSITGTTRDLFDTKKVTAIADFPCNLKYLVEKLHHYETETQIISFISENTIFPYFKLFWTQEKSEAIIELMKNKSGTEIHLRTGTRPNIVKPWKYLRYCPECFTEDKQAYGEAYWHRIHQLPGVLVCPKHGTPTYDSKVRTYEINHQYYYTLTEENTAQSMSFDRFDAELVDRLIPLASDSKWLLDNGMNVESCMNFRDAYINRLREIGMVSKKGQVDQLAFVDSFVEFYGKELLIKLGLPINQSNPHNWVSMMVRKCDEGHHPLRHILMLRFLYGSVQEFFTSYKAQQPFGNGPYPCLNVASDHYKSYIINDVKIEYSRNKKPYAIFSCACGFCYLRNGPDQQESDKYRYDNILSYGDIWTDKFKRLVEIEQLHLREVARVLFIDLKTVRKNIYRLGLHSKWMKLNQRTDKSDMQTQQCDRFDNFKAELRELYRNKWMLLRDNNSSCSKTGLRGLDIKTYNWLYYHDKYWLDNNSPMSVITGASYMRVDWKRRDSEIKTKAEVIVRRILNQSEKPIRISIERIGKELGISFMLRNSLDKLPSTKLFLESVLESKQEFYMRKIKWAIRKLGTNQMSITCWRIKQLIGLSGIKSDEIEDFIKNEILHYVQGKIAG